MSIGYITEVWRARKGFGPVYFVNQQVTQWIPSTKAKAAWTFLEVSVLMKYRINYVRKL